MGSVVTVYEYQEDHSDHTGDILAIWISSVHIYMCVCDRKWWVAVGAHMMEDCCVMNDRSTFHISSSNGLDCRCTCLSHFLIGIPVFTFNDRTISGDLCIYQCLVSNLLIAKQMIESSH